MLNYLADAEDFAALIFEGREPERKDNRELARGRILSAGEVLTLSVPVAGGSHALASRRGLADITVSDHNDWQRRHIAALTTAYQRTPFFEHYAPKIFPIIEQTRGTNIRLVDFLSTLNATLLALLPEPPPLTTPNSQLPTICAEKARLLRPGLSLLDILFRIGPETIFALRGSL